MDRVKLENKNRKTLIIKDGKYYQTSNEQNANRKPQLRSSRTESMKRNNVLLCLSVLSPRKQDINLLSLRQAKYQPKRRSAEALRRTQSEYISNRRKSSTSKQIEPRRRPSIEAELSSLADRPISSEATSAGEQTDGAAKGCPPFSDPNNNENSTENGKGM